MPLDSQNPLGNLSAIASGNGFNMDIAMMLFKSFVVPMLLGYQPIDENYYGYRGKTLRAQMDMEKTQSLMRDYSINPLTLSLVSKVSSLLGAEDPMSWALDKTGKPTGISNMLNQYMNQAFSSIGMSMPDMGLTIGSIRQAVKGLSRPGEEYGLWGEGLNIKETKDLFDKIMAGTFRDADQNQLWGAFNHKDMVEMLQLSREMGVYKNTDISKIPEKLFEFSGVLEKGMKVFGTGNKQEALQNILELTGGETDILDTANLNSTLDRLNNLSELTNISVDIIKKVLETSSGISKSLGMSTAVGNQIGLNTFETIRVLNSLDSTNFLKPLAPVSDPARLSSLISYNTQMLARPEMQSMSELIGFAKELGIPYKSTELVLNLTQDEFLKYRKELFEKAQTSPDSPYKGKSLNEIEQIYLAKKDIYKKKGTEILTEDIQKNYKVDMEQVVLQAELGLNKDTETYKELELIRNKINSRETVGQISAGTEALIQNQLKIFADTYQIADATDIWNMAIDAPQTQKRMEELKKNQKRRDLENQFLELGAVKELSPIYGSLSNFFDTGELSQLIYMYATRPQGLPLYTRSRERVAETTKLSSYFSYIPEFRQSLMGYSTAYGNIIDTPAKYTEIAELLTTPPTSGNTENIDKYKTAIDGMANFTLEQAETKIKQKFPEANINDIYLAWKDIAPKKYAEQLATLETHKPVDMRTQIALFESNLGSANTPEQNALREAIRYAGGADMVTAPSTLAPITFTELLGSYTTYNKKIFESQKNIPQYDIKDANYEKYYKIKEQLKKWETLDNNVKLELYKTIGGNKLTVSSTKDDVETSIKKSIGNIQGLAGFEQWGQSEFDNLTKSAISEYSKQLKDVDFTTFKETPTYKELDTYLKGYFPDRLSQFEKAGKWEDLKDILAGTPYERTGMAIPQRVTLGLKVIEQQEKVAKALESRQSAMIRQQRDEFETRIVLASKDKTAYTTLLESIQDTALSKTNKVYNELKYYDKTANISDQEKTAYFSGENIEGKKPLETDEDFNKRKEETIKRRNRLKETYDQLELSLGTPQAIMTITRDLGIENYTAGELRETINALKDPNVYPVGLNVPNDYKLTPEEIIKVEDKAFAKKMADILEPMTTAEKLMYITRDKPKEFDSGIAQDKLLDKALRREISREVTDNLLPKNELISQVENLLSKSKYDTLPTIINNMVDKLTNWFNNPKVKIGW